MIRPMNEMMLAQITKILVPVLLGTFAMLPIVWFVATMNRFVHLRALIRESWANVDVVLKRRYDLIPNLVETVKAYAAHERETIESVIAARNRAAANHGRISEQASDENQLVHNVNGLLALAERYPDLKANQNFLALQQELVNTEDRIAAARRFYNANVREYNTLCQQLPSMIVANILGHKEEEFFEVEDLSIRMTPMVQL